MTGETIEQAYQSAQSIFDNRVYRSYHKMTSQVSVNLVQFYQGTKPYDNTLVVT